MLRSNQTISALGRLARRWVPMKLATVFFALTWSTASFAFSPVCVEAAGVEHKIDGLIKSERDRHGNGEVSFTVLLPKTYNGDEFRSAILRIESADGAIVNVPLSVGETAVKDWKNKLVAFVHTERNSALLFVEAQYGFPCTFVLSGKL